MKMLKKILGLSLLIAVIAAIFALTANAAADPSGATYTALTGEEALTDVAAIAEKAKYGVSYVWVMICGFMVFFFQCGFAMVETGFCRGKNAAHTMTMNFMVFLVGAIGYFLVGFAIQFGGSGGAATLGSGGAVLDSMFSIPGFGGLFGYKGFMLQGVYDAGVYLLFFFQMVFMDTTVTIPTGSMAERVKYSAIVIASFFISMIYYPLFGNWVWGGGWLATLGVNFGIGHGVVDFAGSAVVHAMGGMLAFTGAIVLGPRIGKFKKDGTARAFPGHNIPMAIIGTIILFFCWFAFNAGSTLNGSDFRLSVVATNTMIAGAIGGLTAMFYMWAKFGKPDPSMTANGTLAGLVAITAPCAFVDGLSAFIIGIVAAFLVCLAVPFFENKLKIDDPVGAISVHGVNGIWGIIALGLFADGQYGDGLNGVAGTVTGLFYGGGTSQLMAQLICVAVILVYGIGFSFIFYKVLDAVWGLRVKPQDELDGLDIPEMGVLGYPDTQLLRTELDYDTHDNAPIKQLARFNWKPGGVKVAAPAGSVSMKEAVPVERAVKPVGATASDIKLTKITLIIKQNKFEELKEAMNEIGVTGMTVTQVMGCGIQKGKTEFYRGVGVEVTLLPKVQVDIVVAKVPVRTVIDTAKQVLYTGNIGDGKIFVYDVENAVKVRTGEEGFDALQDTDE
jgi:Amt family ammonium transporter